MKRPPHPYAFTALCLLLVSPLTAAPDVERKGIWNWSGVPRVIAIGDLHGSYEKFVRLLKTADLVDDDLAWTGGEDHLVIAGDFVDRGNGDRPLMDLLRRLQTEAPQTGGRVHVLLGNHEAMNLMRDTRYVSRGSFMDFTKEETKADREAAWRSFSGARLGLTGIGEVRAEFQRRFPEGYFGRQRLFDLGGEYGEWLRQLPAIVKIDGTLYLHGGLTEEIAALGIDDINRRVHDDLRRHLELRRELETAGVTSSEMNITELYAAAAAVVDRRRSKMAATANAFRESTKSTVLGSAGPLWYRGTSLEDERIERAVVERSLELLDARSMVVAHTHTGGNRITSRFHGRLYRVDHGIAESIRPLALVVKQGQTQVLDSRNGTTLSPVAELPVGRSLQAANIELHDTRQQALLRNGEITHSVELGRGSSRPRLVVVEKNGSRARGVFKTVEVEVDSAVTDRYQHEVAAYALDQVIGLGMVPFTLVRKIDGETGSLQSWIEGAVDHEAAIAYHLDIYDTEETRRQLARARLFDALIGNHDRKPSDVLCLLNDDRVFLIDHSKAFSTSKEMSWKASSEGPIDPQITARLRTLDRRTLQRKLGKLLDAEQIDAVLERRDLILDRLASAAQSAGSEAVVASD